MNTDYQQMLGMKYHAELENGRRDLALKTATRIVDHLGAVDSLNKSDDASQLAVIYETQKKEAKIAEQEASIARQQLVAVLIAFVLVAIFFVVYSLYRRRAARRLAEVKAAKERIESELRIAKEIQQSMVPHVFPERKELDLYASMTPAREVGGDLYDYIMDGDRLYFCVGDVSGKGVPAALFMAQTIRLMRTFAKQRMMPDVIATRLNAELTEGNESGMFVTMFIGLLDLQTGHLDFCNAGHNPPVIGGGDHQGAFLDVKSNAPIGLWPNLEYEGEQMENVKGRVLFVYSDGLNEAENEQKEQLGEQKLIDILRSTDYESSRQVIERMEREVERHRHGAEPNDDLTMMCIHVK
jgi:serine phosphatase RsbU (regulator of sigma subunit)